MRFFRMTFRSLTLLAVAVASLHLAACERKAPEPQAFETPAAPASPPPHATALPSAAPAAAADGPDRLLKSYASALHARDWDRAARVWARESGVTAAILQAAYDRPERPTLEIAKGEVEGAAGSLYYEAPVVLRFGPKDPPERGTLTLRRVNDVSGATAEQRRWHIQRATIGVGQ